MATQDVVHEGGCLCCSLRYRTTGAPSRVTICHCRFCQRATGGSAMVEPVFGLDRFEIVAGVPSVYRHRSTGSDRLVDVHFCSSCATKLFLTFERFPGSCGVYAGTFDHPAWIEIGPENARHIFISSAHPDTILPGHVPLYRDHALASDGTPSTPVTLDEARAAKDVRVLEP